MAASTAANTAAVTAQGQVNKATGSMWGAVGNLATGIAGSEWGQSKLNGMFGGGGGGFTPTPTPVMSPMQGPLQADGTF